MSDSYHDDTGFGGFIIGNIRKAVIRDCLESGDPENYLLNLIDVINDLDDDRSWLEEGE